MISLHLCKIMTFQDRFKRILRGGLGLYCVLSLSGCSGLLVTQQYRDLSPEQIEKLKSIGHEVISCITIGGPPLGGRTTFIVVPKTAKGKIQLTPDCQIKEISVDLEEVK